MSHPILIDGLNIKKRSGRMSLYEENLLERLNQAILDFSGKTDRTRQTRAIGTVF